MDNHNQRDLIQEYEDEKDDQDIMQKEIPVDISDNLEEYKDKEIEYNNSSQFMQEKTPVDINNNFEKNKDKGMTYNNLSQFSNPNNYNIEDQNYDFTQRTILSDNKNSPSIGIGNRSPTKESIKQINTQYHHKTLQYKNESLEILNNINNNFRNIENKNNQSTNNIQSLSEKEAEEIYQTNHLTQRKNHENNKENIISKSRYEADAIKPEKFNEVDKISHESKKKSENGIYYVIALIIFLIGIILFKINKECPKVEVENFDKKFCEWLEKKLEATNDYDLEQINEIKIKLIPIYKDCSFNLSMPKYSRNKSDYYKYRKFSKKFYLEYYVPEQNKNYVMYSF